MNVILTAIFHINLSQWMMTISWKISWFSNWLSSSNGSYHQQPFETGQNFSYLPQHNHTKSGVSSVYILLCTVWVKKIPPPEIFWHFFPKWMGIFSPNFTCLLYIPIYAGLQIFIQLSATLTKSCHIKCDHHHMLKMSTIGRNARWVVALNMA